MTHLSPDEFRALGRRAVDFIADYWETVETLRVAPNMKPGELLAKLPQHPPAAGLGSASSWDPVFADLSTLILPALTHWQSPNFFGFFPANASFPAIVGELLSAGLAQQGMLWTTSPACTELEMRVMDWLAEMLGLPESFRFATSTNGGGVIQGTASEALVSAIVAARHRSLNSLARAAGSSHAPPHFVAYASTQAHSSFIKACMITGLATGPDDRAHCRLIETDDNLAMRPDLLAAAMQEDIAAGRVPFFVMGTIGTTSSTAVDPIDSLANATRAHSPHAWLHVDAAHAGSLLICPEFRHLSKGVEHADSFCFNPHKWLLTNFDCDCFFTRDRESLTNAMSITPEYLRNAGTDSGAVDYRDWHTPLGRRFRALKLWLVIRHYGVEGLQAFIREHVRLASLFESLVREDERFEIATTRTMNLVCIRLTPRIVDGCAESPESTNFRTKSLMDRANSSGKAFFSHTVLPPTAAQPHPRLVIRVAIGATLTEERHVREACELLRSFAG
jgi:aromatic-L-amino-acid decarboxylase